jgi:hypothetical protein
MTSGEQRNHLESSHDSLAGAGWYCQPGSFKTRGGRFSWLDPRTFWQSRRNEYGSRQPTKAASPTVAPIRRIVKMAGHSR